VVLAAPLIVEEKPPASVVPERAPSLTVPYASAGSMEAGAWAGMAASNASIQGQAGAVFGWFFAGRLELSALLGLDYVHPGGGEVSASLLLEPSVHVPFGSSVLGFTGLGGGTTLSSSGFGFALSQRVGVNVILGRNAVLTPALVVLYTTNAPAMTSLGGTVGYSFAW
jgi:hypothetical protein